MEESIALPANIPSFINDDLTQQYHLWRGIRHTVVNEIVTFYPQEGDMRNFQAMAELMLSHEQVKQSGFCKFVPFHGFSARAGGYGDVEMNLNETVVQRLKGNDRAFKSIIRSATLVPRKQRKNSTTPKFSVKEIDKDIDHVNVPFATFGQFIQDSVSAEELDEDDFWRREDLQDKTFLYGTGDGSLFDVNQPYCNLSCLGTNLDDAVMYDGDCPGILKPWSYAGTPGSYAPWHIEDSFLPSINYLHQGSAKVWYIVPPKSGHQFEKMTSKLYVEEFKECSLYQRHKNCVIPPHVLEEEGVPFHKVVHHEGEYIILAPFAYHQVINRGINFSEAVNFGTDDWRDNWLIHFTPCPCPQKIGVKLHVEKFLEAKNPKLYNKLVGTMPFLSPPTSRVVPEKRRKISNLDIAENQVLLKEVVKKSSVNRMRGKELTVKTLEGNEPRTNPCEFCHLSVNNLKAHVKQHHGRERLVEELSAADCRGEKAMARDIMRRIKGNGLVKFMKDPSLNPDCVLLPSRRPREPLKLDNFIICAVCNNPIMKNNSRHECMNRDKSHKNISKSTRETLSRAIERNYDQRLSDDSVQVLASMIQDDIVDCIESDELSIHFLNHKASSKTWHSVSRDVRVLGRILFQARKLGVGTLKDLLKVENLKILRKIIHDQAATTMKSTSIVEKAVASTQSSINRMVRVVKNVLEVLRVQFVMINDSDGMKSTDILAKKLADNPIICTAESWLSLRQNIPEAG